MHTPSHTFMAVKFETTGSVPRKPVDVVKKLSIVVTPEARLVPNVFTFETTEKLVHFFKHIVSIRLTDHHSRRHGIPFEPECDEGAGYQNNAGDENCGEIKGPIPREDQIHFQAAVIT